MGMDDINSAMGKMYPAPKATPSPVPSTEGYGQRIANAVPEPVWSMASWFQKNINDPLDTMAHKGSEFGAEMGQAAANAYIPNTPPLVAGVARGAGSIAGGAVADPRNWPFFASGAARPLLQKIISRGFTVQMGKGTLDAVVNLHDNWDKMTPEQRAEEGTKAGLSGVMAGLAARHGLSGRGVDTHEAPPPTETTPVPPEAPAEPSIQDKLIEETKKSLTPSKPTPPSRGSQPLTDPTSAWRKRLAEHVSGRHPLTPEELRDWQPVYQDTQAAAVMGARPWDHPQTPFNIDEKTLSSAKASETSSTEESNPSTQAPTPTGRSVQTPTENDQILEGKGDVPPVELEENLVPKEARASTVIPKEEQAALNAKMEGRGASKEALEKGETPEQIVNGAGGQYKGIQEGAGKIPEQVLFNHPETGSTLALPSEGLTPEVVKDKLTSHKADWDSKTGFLVGDKIHWGPNRVEVIDKLEDGSYKIRTKEGREVNVDPSVLSKDKDMNQAGMVTWGGKGPVPPPQQYGSKGILSRVLDAVTETRRSPEEQQARNILREMGGKRQRTIDQLYAEFGKAASAHDGDSVDDLIRFNDWRRLPTTAGKDIALASRLEEVQKQIWDELHQLNPTRFDKGIENYLGRLFKGSRGLDTVSRIIFTKRPIEGGKGWMKGRVWDWMDESIAAGAEPITNNPIRMQLLSIYQHTKYLTAHRTLEGLKDSGLVKFHKLGDAPTNGWTRIDDSIFEPRQMTKEGLIEHGNYWSHPDVAKVFNTLFQPGLRQFQIYNTLRAIGDFQNQMQLGFSAYHATFSTVSGAISSDFALGLERIFNYGKPLQGAKSFVNAIQEFNPFAKSNTYHLGKMVEEEWLAPGTHPALSSIADMYERAGGRLGSGLQHDKYSGESTVPIRAIGRELKGLFVNGKYWEGIKRTPLAASEATSRWLMRYYVPRLKMGVFARMANEKYEAMLKDGASANEIASAISRISDSVDNRLGQVIYDNRFIHRIGKDLAQLTVRSVGWNWGTIGELGGGIKDIGVEGIKALRGQKAELTHRAAYVMGMTMVTGAMGAAMNWAMSGLLPKKPIDYFFPQTGNLDAQGNPERVSLPTYMKDVFSYNESISRTLMHKLHPMWSTLAEMYQNENYYGQEIETPGASWMEHRKQDAKYLAGQFFVPISLKSAQQRISTGAGGPGAVLGAEFGIVPAPRYIGQTKAEKLAYELSNRHQARGPHGEATTEQWANYGKIRNLYNQGKLSEQQLMQEFNKGTISASQYDKMGEEKNTPPIVRHVHSLYPDEALSVWNYATDEEKLKIKDEMLRQYDVIDERKNPELLKDYDKIFFKSHP